MNPELIDQFSRYTELIRINEDVRNQAREDLASEVLERLRQLSYITIQLNQIDMQFGQLAMVERVSQSGEKEFYSASFERDEHLRFVMRLLTESFYYFSFRIRQILRNKDHQFPHLKNFESIGVRDVRNHLIEHPNGQQSQIFNQTFMWTQDSGMHLKSGRHDSESSNFADVGLKANAKEFAKELGTLLDRAITALTK